MSSGEGPAGDRTLRADARRNMEKVMAAAAEAFAADGLDVPLEDIARNAGVRAGTIYNRFGSREGLLDAVVADAAAGWLRAVVDRAAGQGTAWGRLAAFVQGMCEEQAADPVFNDVFSRRYPDAPGLQAVCAQSLAFGAALIADAQAEGALRPGVRADDLARIFAVNAYLLRDRPAGDDGWRRTLQFTLDGLRGQPDSTCELPAGDSQ
ncbi:MAG TPA: TetR/AcrR family transcriptional regulator [Trebonia sp.]|nr:TetR/AcrR family transcriptional regulator [Trebonia sp.]